MSRPSNYEFISANPEVIERDVTTMYTALTGREVRASSPEKLFIQWVAAAMVLLAEQINFAGKQNIPSKAVGEGLDNIAQIFFAKTRPPAAILLFPSVYTGNRNIIPVNRE